MRTSTTVPNFVSNAYLLATLLWGCTASAPTPFAPVADGAVTRGDGGPIRVSVRDAGATPDGGADGDIDGDADVGPDAGRLVPQIDGIIAESEWADAASASAITPPAPPFPFDRLSQLVAIRTDTTLYLGISGAISSGSVLMLWLDTELGSDEGAVLSGRVFTDFDGALDAAISEQIWLTDAPDFRPDYAWGTTFMPFSATAADAESGWRRVAEPTETFEWLSRGVISQCRETQCETLIPLDTPGFTSTGTIAVAVRIGNTFGALSNQTLPQDDPNAPETLTTFLLIPPG